uniref:Uncharacterized protein n=1 Tax=viral metagenome TaxID=1070528 RepID=A0A6H1ZYG5_9ZZZZ
MNREVNTEVQELDGDKIAEEGQENEDEDEVIVPEDKIPTEKQAIESKTSEPSPEDDLSKQNGLKDVDGETPKERGLRAELTRLRQERRIERQTVTDPAKEAPKEDKLQKLRENYSDEEITKMEEAIDVIASSKGYIKKEQSFQQVANEVLEDFISDNPEYNPEKDPDDIRWNRFKNILIQDYNISGKTGRQLKVIYAKVHRDIQEELGETITNPHNPKKTQAQAQKIKSVSHTGGTRNQPSKGKLNVDDSTKSLFKGFSDDDF